MQPLRHWLPSVVVTAPRLSQSKLFAVESVVPFVVSSFWLAVLAICEQLEYERTLILNIRSWFLSKVL